MTGTNTKLTAAGRLLQAVEASGAIELSHLAGRLGISMRRLEECRDGVRALNLEHAPEHARLASKLHGQAQAALRMRDGDVATHSVYYQRHYWERAR